MYIMLSAYVSYRLENDDKGNPRYRDNELEQCAEGPVIMDSQIVRQPEGLVRVCRFDVADEEQLKTLKQKVKQAKFKWVEIA